MPDSFSYAHMLLARYLWWELDITIASSLALGFVHAHPIDAQRFPRSFELVPRHVRRNFRGLMLLRCLVRTCSSG